MPNLKDVVLIYDCKHSSIPGSSSSFPVGKDQVIHVEPVLGLECDINTPHEFSITTLELDLENHQGTIRLYQKSQKEFYSIESVEFKEETNPSSDFDWRINLNFERNSTGDKISKFKLPTDVDFVKHPRIDVSIFIKSKIGSKSIHGICRVYVKNA
ncbi:MAG: hypothetical protein KDC80_28860 [Saprospiraceae bacterium]|nr:hypothetical protein [Saprospiraceae bacterium]